MALHPYTRLFSSVNPPTVNSDNSAGYEIGDHWVTSTNVYICLDASTGTAVWQDLSSGVWSPTATSDLNMSNFDIDNIDTANFIASPGGTLAERSLQWAADDETLQVGLHGNVVLQVGQETLILVKNQTGAQLSDGKVAVYDGAIGASGRMKAKYGIADGTMQGKLFIGIITENIANGDDGFVTMFGKVRGITTDGSNYGETWVDGDILWASPTTPGALTNIEPDPPNLRLPIAVVITAHSTTGTIFVRMTTGAYLHELHDAGVSSPLGYQVLTYDAVDELWKNGPISDLTTLGHFRDINRFGFIASYDGSTGVTLSFDPVTYTFTLTDTGSGWGYYLDGLAYRFTGNKTVILPGTPPTKGTYYIYFDDGTGTLKQSTTPWSLEGDKIPVAMILWDNAMTPKYWLGDERHTSSMDRRVHLYLHSNFGSRWNNGGVPSGYNISPSTPVNADNTFGISAAVMYDEDIKHSLSALVDPNGSTNSYVIMFKSGGNWVWEYSTMPYRFTAAGYIQYDNAGTMTQGSTARFYNTYLLITNFAEISAGVGNFQIIHGKQEFSSLSAAQAEDPFSFDFTGFPLVECVLSYQFTWQTSNAYTTNGECRLAAAPRKLGGSITTSTVASTLTQEEVEDIVGGMVDGNTETGISVTYDDVNGVLNFDAQTAGDLRYAPIAKGVTNGDSHNHEGGDGAQIDYNNLANIPSVILTTGWIEKTETWTRTGDHTFTVSGNVTSIYRQGTKIRYKQGGGYEYGVIRTSSYSASTTVTLITNTDYAMAAATITDKAISYIDNPETWPGWFTYTPTWTAVTTNPVIGNGTLEGYWTTYGLSIFVKVRMIAGSTTTFGTGYYDFATPVPSLRLSNSVAIESAAGNVLSGGVRHALSSFIRSTSIRGVYGDSLLGSTAFVWASGDIINLSGMYEY